jgi:hypothetical protein
MLRRHAAILDNATRDVMVAVNEAAWPAQVLRCLEHTLATEDPTVPSANMAHVLLAASHMMAIGYSLRGHELEARFLEPLYKLVTSYELFGRNCVTHRWVCGLFAGVSSVERAEQWHFSSVRGRVPVLPWRPMYEFVKKVEHARSCITGNQSFAYRRDAVLHSLRNAILEARVLFPPRAFVEVWHEMRDGLNVHTHWGWPNVGLLLPMNRLFGGDPAFPASDEEFDAEVRTAEEIIECAIGTSHWSSASGTPNFGMLRLLRRLWIAYLQASPEDPKRQAALDQVFSRKRVVPFVFHIALQALRVPISSAEEHQRPANVEESRLHFGEGQGTVRGEVADALVAFVSDDLDDEFWSLFTQMCRIAEVHATAASTRRSSYATSFVAHFLDKLSRRVRGEIVPGARVNAKHRLTHRALNKVVSLTRPLGLGAAFGSNAGHAVSIMASVSMFQPTAAVAEQLVALAKMGLQASNESHQITRSVELLGGVVSQLWCARLIRSPRFDAGAGAASPTEAQDVLRRAMPELIPSLLLGLDPNDIAKINPCCIALHRLFACAAASGIRCDESVLGMNTESFAISLVERVTGMVIAFPTASKSARSMLQQANSTLAAYSSTIIERLLDAGAADALARSIDKHFANIQSNEVTVYSAFAMAAVTAGGSTLARLLLPKFLARADPFQRKEAEAMDQTLMAVTMISASTSATVLALLPVIREAIDAWSRYERSKDARGRSKLRCVQMAGKLTRATVFGLLSLEFRLPEYKSTDGLLRPSSHVTANAIKPSPEAVEAAYDLVVKAATGPLDVIRRCADDAGYFHDAASYEEVLRALTTLRYVLAGDALRLFDDMSERKLIEFSGGFTWDPAADLDKAEEPWWKLPTGAHNVFYANADPRFKCMAVVRVVLQAMGNMVAAAEKQKPVDIAVIKSLKNTFKLLRVLILRKSGVCSKVVEMTGEIAGSMHKVSPDGYHFPDGYYLAKVRHNVLIRKREVRSPASKLAVFRDVYSLAVRCALLPSSALRVRAQALCTDSLQGFCGASSISSAAPLYELWIKPLLESPAAFAGLPDHEITGRFYLLNDLLSGMWTDIALLRLALRCAKTIMNVPEFATPSNETRRIAFFDSLRSTLKGVHGSPDVLKVLAETFRDIVEGGADAPVVTLSRYFRSMESLMPDPDVVASQAAKGGDGPTSLDVLVQRMLHFTLYHASDLSATTTEAPGALINILANAIPKRPRVRVSREELSAHGTAVRDGKTYGMQKWLDAPILFPPAEEKLLLVHPDDDEDHATLVERSAAKDVAGAMVFQHLADVDADTNALSPSSWLIDFFNLAISTQRTSFDANQAIFFRIFTQVASLAPGLDGRRFPVAHLIQQVAMENISRAAQGEQVREQVYVCSTGVTALAGSWRAASTLPAGPERATLFESFPQLVRMACTAQNIASEVLEALEQALTYVVHTVSAEEMSQLVTCIAEVVIDAEVGNSQQAVRGMSLLSSLGLLGLATHQYVPLLREMGKVVTVMAPRCNHQMRVALISLTYKFFYAAAFHIPSWLMASLVDTPFASDAERTVRDASVAPEVVREITALRERIWNVFASQLGTVPHAVGFENDVEAPKSLISLAKAFLASMSGSQSVMIWRNETAGTDLILRIAAIAVADGDDLRALVKECAWMVAFQRHTVRGSREIAERALQELENPSANKRSKMVACFMARVVGYLNQLQWPAEDWTSYANRLMSACMNNVDSKYPPLRTELQSTFSVFCRLVARDVVRKIAVRCNKVMAASGAASPTSPVDPAAPFMSKSTAILTSTFIAIAFPETVPDFVPRVLTRLARWSALPPSEFESPAVHADVTTTVRKAMKVWWASHRDEWQYRHKDAFTAEQQEILMDHFQGHSYYA